MVMDDVNNLSLGYYPVSSPCVSSPDILGDINPASFPQCKLDSNDQSVCCATFWLFKVGDVYILDDLRKLVVHFGLMWNCVASRSGSSFRCNRYTRPGSSSRKVILRKASHIACGCDWCIRFNWAITGIRNGINCVKITYIFGSHTNTCDISNVDQLISWSLLELAQVLMRSVHIRSCPRLWFVWVLPIVRIFNLWSRF